MVNLVNSLFSHHEMSPLAFSLKTRISRGFWGWWGDVRRWFVFPLVCLCTNSDSVKKEMHKWHSVESASVSAQRWQNASFRGKSLEMALIVTLWPAKKHIFAIIEKARCFWRARVACVSTALSPRLLDSNETFTFFHWKFEEALVALVSVCMSVAARRCVFPVPQFPGWEGKYNCAFWVWSPECGSSCSHVAGEIRTHSHYVMSLGR